MILNLLRNVNFWVKEIIDLFPALMNILRLPFLWDLYVCMLMSFIKFYTSMPVLLALTHFQDHMSDKNSEIFSHFERQWC